MVDPNAFPAEIISVIAAGFLVLASVLAQHVSNVARRGPGYAMSDRSTPPEMTGFYGRATRTLANNVESALMYAPPTLIAIILGKAGALSHSAAVVYIAARTIFTLCYWLKISAIRSLAWLAGMLSIAAMYYVAVEAAMGK